MSDHFVGKVTQKALIFHDGKVLLNRDVGIKTYDLPGGRVHVGEDPKAGLRREIKEELAIDVEVDRPFFVCTTLWGQERSPHYFVVFEASLVSDIAAIRPDGTEVGEARWVTRDEAETIDLHAECRNAIQTYFASVA